MSWRPDREELIESIRENPGISIQKAAEGWGYYIECENGGVQGPTPESRLGVDELVAEGVLVLSATGGLYVSQSQK